MNEIASNTKAHVGKMALMMLGATNLMEHENELSFNIRGSSKSNHIKITLNGKDLYDLEFGILANGEYKVVSEVSDVYNDNLNEVIKEHTGLYTSF